MSRFHAIASQSIESLFRVFADQALLVFKDGTQVNAPIISRFPDEIVDILDTRVHSATRMFDIKISDMPTGRILEEIHLNNRIYKVQGEPIADQHNLALKVEAYEIESSPEG